MDVASAYLLLLDGTTIKLRTTINIGVERIGRVEMFMRCVIVGKNSWRERVILFSFPTIR